MRLLLLLLIASYATCQQQDCKPPSCNKYCPNGYSTDVNGCHKCECNEAECAAVTCNVGLVCRVLTLSVTQHRVVRCVDLSMPVPCHMPQDPGPCEAAMKSFSYDNNLGKCVPFYYGGCQGNSNRFPSEDKCNNFCKRGVCSSGQCRMFCPYGFRLDSNGCEKCECKDNSDVGVHVNCPKTSCLMECPTGFVKDENGCEKCECKSECSPVLCNMYCKNGMMKDERGCTICKCNDCEPLNCSKKCDIGLKKDIKGCDVCECENDPCKMTSCSQDKHCIAKHDPDGKMVAECVAGRHWCSSIMCAMYCKHGFVSDEFGCDVCKCRDEPMPLCPMMKCVANCHYGYRFNADHCRTCDCLPNPCHNYKCSENEVCEPVFIRDCYTCPVLPHCISNSNVRRVFMTVEYAHEQVKVDDLDEFKKLFERSVTYMLAPKTYDLHSYKVMRIKVQQTSPITTVVTCHVVAGDRNDLVKSVDDMVMQIKTHDEFSPIVFHGVNFVPEHATLKVEYYTDVHIPPDNDDREDSGSRVSMLVPLIVCVVVIAAILILVGIFVALFCHRNRNRKAIKSDKNKDVIYKKAKTSDLSNQKKTKHQSQQPTLA